MPDPTWIATRARELRSDPTDAERALWRSLRQRRFAGHKFRRQVPLGDYIVDFACLDARLIVEVDGAHHLDQQREQDSARDAWLREQGFCVLRFWNSQVLTAPDEVDQAIWNALQGLDGTPPPQPSPVKGEGAGGQA